MPRPPIWDKLTPRLKEARRQRERAEEARLPPGIPLAEVRRARRITQVHLAAALKTRQSTVSVLERRRDLRVSSLRAYITALGGELDLVARFPGGAIHRLRFTP
ncbi:MAG TPA: hypothetical protein VFU23_15555 [Gemmatimonadales bacterium]|nr:hypothetical protein [Gemmatimonadales bacterium]